MLNKNSFFVLLLFLSLAMPVLGFSDVSKVMSVDDTYFKTVGAYDEDNFGGSTINYFDDGSLFKAMIYFNYSPVIPANSTINSANIHLYYSKGTFSNTKTYYPISKEWHEGTGTGANNNGILNGTTYFERWFGANDNDGCGGATDPDWCASGLQAKTDYNDTAGFYSTSSGGTGWSYIDVKAWVNQTVRNVQDEWGWLLVNEGGGDHGVYAKEHGTTTRHPFINISWSFPEPVFIMSPANDSLQDTSSIDAWCNVSMDGVNKDSNVSKVSIYILNSSVVSDSNILYNYTKAKNALNITQNYSSPSLSNDAFWVVCGAWIDYNEVSSTQGEYRSEARLITVYTIAPMIEFSSGAPANLTNISQTWIYLNISLTAPDLKNLTYFLKNGTAIVNQTNFTSAVIEINWTGLIDDEYFFNVSVFDQFNNFNSTKERSLILDSTPPAITVYSPTPQNYVNNDSLWVNLSVTDALVGTDSCWYSVSIDGGAVVIYNTSLVSCLNTSFGLPEGDEDYVITIWANDSLNNLDSTQILFGLRMVSPSVNLNDPGSSSYLSQIVDVEFNFTATDLDGVSYCKLYGNWTNGWHVNKTLTPVTSGVETRISYVNLSEGSYLWNVWCNDSNNNAGYALSNQTFTLDVTAPIINISDPVNSSSVSTTFTFDHNFSDLNFDSCYFNSLNSLGAWQFSPNQSLPCSDGTKSTSVDAGTLELHMWGTDLAGNIEETWIALTATTPTIVVGSTGGGGSSSDPAIITELLPASNFSIQSTGGGDLLDIVLAKDSVRERKKSFIVINNGIEPITVNLACVASTNSSIDICDYVSFENESLLLDPNELDIVYSSLSILTPPNSSFGDEFGFNVFAYQALDESKSLFSKVSSKARLPVWGKVYMWKYLPLQGDVEQESKGSYPVLMIAVLFSFIAFAGIYLLLQSSFALTGFVLGVLAWMVIFSLTIFF